MSLRPRTEKQRLFTGLGGRGTIRRLATPLMIAALALFLSHVAIAQAPPPPPPPGPAPVGPTQTAAEALTIITNAVGGNATVANSIIGALGGDPIAAMNAIAGGSASSILTGALGSGAVDLLASALGGSNALGTLTGALGQSGAINALISGLGGSGALSALTGALGGSGSVSALAGALLGNRGAGELLQGVLAGNVPGLNALSSFLGGNMGALGSLTSALGGTSGAISAIAGVLGGGNALSALTGVLGGSGALSALTGALGVNGALGALTNALGLGGAVGALTGALGGQVLSLLGLSSICGIAPLTGVFTVPACAHSKNNRAITYAQQRAGGQQIGEHVNRWWATGMQEAMKGMTAQWHAGVLDQTRLLGSINDAAITADTARVMQSSDTENRRDLQVSAQSCPLPSNSAAIAQTSKSAAAIAQGMKQDLARNAQPTPGTPSANGPAAATRARFDEYCANFHDDANNNGVSGCEPLPPAGGGADPANRPMPDGDIDVESILLKDSIDMDDEQYRTAAVTILRNIVQPKVYPKLSDDVLDTATGKEYTVRKERVETVRKIAADVVAGMIARRTGIELPDEVLAGQIIPSEQPPPNMASPTQCSVPNAPGNKNAYSFNYARSKLGSTAYRRTSGGRVTMTYCQRLSREASQNYAQGGSAMEAWRRFQRMGVAQPFNLSQMRPGDLVYMTSYTRNGRKYGHTGIYSGNGNFISALSRGVGEMPLTGTGGWQPRSGMMLGFVRPSGVNASVAGCNFDNPTGTQPPETSITEGASYPTGGTPDSSKGSYDDFFTALGQKESGGCGNQYNCVNGSGFMGKYQMGAAALIDIGCVSTSDYVWVRGRGRPWKNYLNTGIVWKSCNGATLSRRSDFLNNHSLQEWAIRKYMEKQHSYIASVWDSACSTIGGAALTPSGMLAGAHLVGHTAMKAFVNSGGSDVRADGNGVPITNYMNRFGGYDTPFSDTACNSSGLGNDYSTGLYTPPPPRPVKEIIQEIRQRAGIPDEEIAEKLSYNEIMLALTKERFFDPRYFQDMGDNLGAMKHNETVLNAYTSMMLNDIHTLQEQINALVAARASLRLEAQPELDTSKAAPLR